MSRKERFESDDHDSDLEGRSTDRLKDENNRWDENNRCLLDSIGRKLCNKTQLPVFYVKVKLDCMFWRC